MSVPGPAGVVLLLAAVLAAGPAWAAVSVRAELDPSRIVAGETASLVVVVDGAGGRVDEPRVALPGGISVLGTSRSESFSWVNGRSTTRTVFRMELAAERPGSFRVGPVRVRVRDQWFESPYAFLTVAPARVQLRREGAGPASLVLEATPRDPYVGQPVVLKVRLIQRASLVEDPEYSPPATPGFWAERSTAPESYYADEGTSRVLVTETRTRLYPLASGTARISGARVALTLALPSSNRDPFAWFGGGGPRRRLLIESAPVDVRVRPLPAGAPEGFDGAVGRFSVAWSADRGRTNEDVPVTVRLDVRGEGNLPLLRTPPLVVPGAEVFSSTVQDSLGTPGGSGPGRRRIQWTVLPRRSGTLRLVPPRFVWFDLGTGRYASLDAPPLMIQVDPPLHASTDHDSEFPRVFTEHPVDPLARPANAWGFAAAGALVGLAVRGIRGARARARQAEAPPPTWLEGLRHAHGASFWAAAARACAALAERGVDVSELRRRTDAARYGGVDQLEEPVRKALLARFAPARARRGLAGSIPAVIAIVLAVALGVVSAPMPGDPADTRVVARADASARTGDLPAAAQRWRALWDRGARHPGLAARLAWASVHDGQVAAASLWVLRGDAGEPRDAALVWVTHQVRDAGGLQGFTSARIPIRSLEWAIAAAVCALGLARVGRRAIPVLVGVALLLSSMPAADRWRASLAHRAVVREVVALEGEGLELTPGQVVEAPRTPGPRVRVRIGAGLSGWVPTQALWWAERR